MPYILLDRDGVINYDSDEYIKSPDEWHAIPGSLQAIANLNHGGFHVLIVSNQSGIARGYYTLATLELIHKKLLKELETVGGCIKDIFFCPHHPDEACSCRKPNPGLFQQIAKKYPIIFSETYYIGDAYSDVLVARTVGCMPILVHTGKGEQTLKQNPELNSIPNFINLAHAVDYVLCQLNKE